MPLATGADAGEGGGQDERGHGAPGFETAPAAVHGDARNHNLVRSGDGRIVFVDLDTYGYKHLTRRLVVSLIVGTDRGGHRAAARSTSHRWMGTSPVGEESIVHSMADIVRQIDAEREALSEGLLFKWLSDESVDGYRRLSFLPSMLYYLMGFKDVLTTLSRDNPQTDLEHHINAYCLEDADHWRWYLTDLDKIGFDLTCWGETIFEWCNEVWSPATEINRKMIFRLIHFTMSQRDFRYQLALILVFEATGVVFIGHTRKAAIALGMDEELQYLGRAHYEEEAAHSVKPEDVEHHELSSELYEQIRQMVEVLFVDYRELFDCWYQHREKFPMNPGVREPCAEIK
ncbi:MAG: hypothetical protein ACRDRI_15475 [Pseudonocardiaceae bacterium]